MEHLHHSGQVAQVGTVELATLLRVQSVEVREIVPWGQAIEVVHGHTKADESPDKEAPQPTRAPRH